jgi:hypothetical protein
MSSIRPSFDPQSGALYETFPAPETHRLFQRLDRRFGERKVLVAEIEAWRRRRNDSGASVKWTFTTQKARHKLTRAYPDTAKVS